MELVCLIIVPCVIILCFFVLGILLRLDFVADDIVCFFGWRQSARMRCGSTLITQYHFHFTPEP